MRFSETNMVLCIEYAGDENMVSRKNARQGASKNGNEGKPGPLWSGENFRVPTVQVSFHLSIPWPLLLSCFGQRFASTVLKSEFRKYIRAKSGVREK